MIFADGAGAVVLQKSEQENVGIIATNTVCDNAEELLYLENSHSLNPEADQEKCISECMVVKFTNMLSKCTCCSKRNNG